MSSTDRPGARRTFVRHLWRGLPLPQRARDAAVAVYNRAAIRADRRSRRREPTSERPGPLVVTGFFSEVSGVARAAELTVRALRDAGLDPLLHDARDALSGVPPPDQGGVWLLHCNAPEADAVLFATPAHHRRGRTLIGYWTWETPDLPSAWAEMADDFAEIWTPSTFVADQVRLIARRVCRMPHPVQSVRSARARRYDRQRVTFLSTADARSDFARKNVTGSVSAFKSAFPEPRASARLVVKLLNADEDPAGVARVRAAMDGRPDIQLIDTVLTDGQMAALFEEADVLLSLHRSEGFGLTIAEAMADGMPVIATGWSGNLDVADATVREALVDYTLAPVDGSRRYAGSVWAEPDIASAAELIRRLAEDAGLRQRLGRAGRARVARLSEPWSRERLQAHEWFHLVEPSQTPSRGSFASPNARP